MSLVTHVKSSWRVWLQTYGLWEWVTSYVTCDWVMSHVCRSNVSSSNIWTSHVWYMDESPHTYELVASHTWMSRQAVVSHTWMNVTHRHESQRVWCQKYSLGGWVTSHLTYEWVISRIHMCHVYVTWLIHDSFMTHSWLVCTLQHTATHCNTLQHTATHCNTLQHTATHCNTLLFITRSWLVHYSFIQVTWLSHDWPDSL